jgi:hypothetical protein
MKQTTLIDKKTFDKLSLNEKRVALAKDVIARIEADNFKENSGELFRGAASYKTGLDPKDAINNNTCEVCARGAILCSWIGNFNEVKWNEIDHILPQSRVSSPLVSVYSSTLFPPQILEVFGREMLDNMEAAFEATTYDWHYDENETRKYADAFCREVEVEGYYEDTVTVGAPIIEIMEHIIHNNGEFPLP